MERGKWTEIDELLYSLCIVAGTAKYEKHMWRNSFTDDQGWDQNVLERKEETDC